MKEYTSDKLRTVAVIGHGSVGKTSLCDALSFTAGGSARLGSVDDGTSVFDHSSESRDRKHSLTSSIGICEWSDHKINILSPAPFDRSSSLVILVSHRARRDHRDT